MCDVLVTKDGIELWSTGDAARYGLQLPEDAFDGHYGTGNCLCRVDDLAEVLAAHPSAWKRDDSLVVGGWSEVGDDGRTWWEGYDVRVGHDRFAAISRSDGRTAWTLEQWEASRAEPSRPAQVVDGGY